MENKIVINKPTIIENTITYNYEVFGKWKEAFNDKCVFKIEYTCDISQVPESVCIIPLLGNVLPMSWVYDAEIILEECDEDFYNCIDNVKNGYKNMFPNVTFGGKITATKVVKNDCINNSKSLAFFSGGVDAFNTLIMHEKENPILFTLWGSDVKVDDEDGWKQVDKRIKEASKNFDVNYDYAKTEFRNYLKEGILCRKVNNSGDNWWHGFQHGLGIITHAAPVCYIKKVKNVYFASSFTIADKGKVTCASDPTIDNYIRYCNTNIIHDGYEFNRSQKIDNIYKFCKANNKTIKLHVCWESTGGKNCCNCEKCLRTILGLYSVGANPIDYGFNFTKQQLVITAMNTYASNSSEFISRRYIQIRKSMKEHGIKSPKYVINIINFGLSKFNNEFNKRVYRKIKRTIFK